MIASISQAEPPGLGRRIVRLFRPHRGGLALIILTILTTSALSVISALLVRQVFDKALFVRGGPNRGYPLARLCSPDPKISRVQLETASASTRPDPRESSEVVALDAFFVAGEAGATSAFAAYASCLLRV
jgi:hypothetical protein